MPEPWMATTLLTSVFVAVFLLQFDHTPLRFDNMDLKHTRTPSYSRSYEQHMHRLMKNITLEVLQKVLTEHTHYRSQHPFPHGHIDGLFPQDVLEAVSLEIPDDPVTYNTNTKTGCILGFNKCYSGDSQNFKRTVEDEGKFGPATLSMFQFLKTPLFTSFLENMTGISALIPDPAYRGSGIHQTLQGGYLGIHADFNLHQKYKNMHRRVNVFVFLNEDWKTEYGGALELWHKDLQSCGAKYLPVMNRLLVFSSTDFSYHGQPQPLSCPHYRSRRSLALYYYTKTRPTTECIDGKCFNHHTTLFHKPVCKEGECASCSNSNITAV